MTYDITKARRQFLDTVYKSGLAIALSRFSLLTVQASALGAVPEKMADNKSIFELMGQVFVNGEAATMDTFIRADATIETRSNSYIIFKVGKDAHILRENSQLTLQGSNTFETGLNLITGKILSVFGKRKNHQPQHMIRTSTATIGIRGTAVYAESNNDMSYLCTCYGKTQIQALSDPSQVEDIATSHHDSPRFILKEPSHGKLIVPAPVFNHTDEELMLIETLVGRASPISAVQGYRSPRKGY